MLSLLIGIFTLILILICVLLVLVILMQRPSADAGMGASLAGGAAESAFGGETGNVLTRVCVKCIVVFFVLTFSLFLANIYLKSTEKASEEVSAPTMAKELEQLANSSEKAGEAVKKEAADAAQKVNETADKPEAKSDAKVPAPQAK